MNTPAKPTDNAGSRERESRLRRRSPENTTLTISITNALSDAIREMAAAEGRTVSQWMRVHLAKLADMELDQKR